MKSIELGDTSLDSCILSAQSERIVVTRAGHPVALIVGVEGLDAEQIQLGCDDEFWKMIQSRRQEPTIDRAELERRLAERELK